VVEMTLTAQPPGLTIILPDQIPTDHRALVIGAALRVLLLVLVLVLTILVTVGLPTLVVDLPLGIRAATAIQATTILQGTLAVLGTILLVPLVTTQNHLQAIEGCKKKRFDKMAYDRYNSRLLVLSQDCLLALVQHPTSLRRQTPGLLPHGVFSYLG